MNAIAPATIGIITGITAAGKTAIALELAAKNQLAGRPSLEIVNADSLLVYRGMDIGTAKPDTAEQARVPHHLLDLCHPNEPFTAGDFSRQAKQAIAEIEARGNRALVVGGTGFYLKALLYGVWDAPPANPLFRERLAKESADALYARLKARDLKAALRIGRNDQYRLIRALELIELGGKSPTELEALEKPLPDPRFRLWIVDRLPSELDGRIVERTRAMIRSGLVEETERLLSRYPGSRALGSVGYAQTVRYLQGIPPEGRKLAPGLEGLENEITLATRQLVKKQRTWFKGQHAEGRWFLLDSERAALKTEFESIYG